jgi:protein-disulfide isomerase
VDRTRLILLGAAALAAIVVAVVLVLVGTGGGSSGTATSSNATGTTSAPPPASLAGIPQHGDTLGRASAPVTVSVFEDPQCPYCREWNVDTLSSVVTDYVKTGRIKLVYRGIEIIGPNSVQGLRAIYAAAAQNKLWQMVDALYARQGAENSGWITPQVISAAAREAGADPTAIASASSSAAVTAMLKNAGQEATADAIGGTPTFVVQRPPGLPTQLQLAGLDPASFAAALNTALQ